MSKANETQVGGNHYKDLGDFQPWDVLKHWLTPEEYRGYQKGVAIAYLARERSKGGDQDIKKATHHLQKLIEVVGDQAAGPGFPYIGECRRRAPRDASEAWPAWDGRGRPVDPERIVDVRLRDGGVHFGYRAGQIAWNHDGGPGDVVAYCVHEKAGD